MCSQLGEPNAFKCYSGTRRKHTCNRWNESRETSRDWVHSSFDRRLSIATQQRHFTASSNFFPLIQHLAMTMEPLSPIYPQNEDIYRPSNQEPNAQPPKPERSAPAMYPSFPSPSHQEASTSSDPSVANDYTSTSDWQHSSYAQLYSPTREEIEKHPIRQRLSQVRDDIVSALGSGSAPTEGFQKKTALLFDNSSRQAAEGSERLFDAMAEVPNVKEGDKGMFVLFRLALATSMADWRWLCAQARRISFLFMPEVTTPVLRVA